MEYEIYSRKQEQALARLRNPCSGKEILKFGQICGCGVHYGGREGTYLVNPKDNSRLPVSVHPRDVSPGMRNAAYKFVRAVVVTQAAVI